MNISSTIANARKRLSRPHNAAQRSHLFDYQVDLSLLYAVGHAGDYPEFVASGTADACARLDFLPPHVYPEACHSKPTG